MNLISMLPFSFVDLLRMSKNIKFAIQARKFIVIADKPGPLVPPPLGSPGFTETAESLRIGLELLVRLLKLLHHSESAGQIRRDS